MIDAKSITDYNHEKEENIETLTLTYHKSDREFVNNTLRPLIEFMIDNYNTTL